MKPQISQIDLEAPRSGYDLDVWGGADTTPVLIPRPGGNEPCPRKIDGHCPPGCVECLVFAEEMKINPAQSARGLEVAENG